MLSSTSCFLGLAIDDLDSPHFFFPPSVKMATFFNPANPRFRRGVMLLSTVSCTVVAVHIVMADFGSQEHVFSPVQRYLIPRIDAFFDITQADIDAAHAAPAAPSILPRVVYGTPTPAPKK